MKARFSNTKTDARRASVLVIVLWVAFGLCSIALYFAHSMSMELKAADNQVADMEAEQAIEGAAVYVSNFLCTLQVSNNMPAPTSFRADNVKVGNARFWLIGQNTNDTLQTAGQADHPYWGLVDEASKVNLNNATAAMLQNLPNMTANTAAAMFDWQTNTTTPSTDGAKSETYSALNPPYLCKSAPYETPDELALVYGLNMDLLYGEDANLNGILDPNENDGATTPPNDNQDGILDPGLLSYVTTFTRGESTLASNGVARVAITDTPGIRTLVTSQSQFQQFESYLPTAASTSVLQFYMACAQKGMTATDFEQMESYLMNANTKGLININTASATALACIPGIGINMAPQIVNYRQSNPQTIPTISWLPAAIGNDPTLAAQIGPYITAYSYQYTADIAAVGHNGRGYRRVRFVFDISSGTPLIVYRQDLTGLGWALGKKLHDQLLAGNN